MLAVFTAAPQMHKDSTAGSADGRVDEHPELNSIDILAAGTFFLCFGGIYIPSDPFIQLFIEA